MLYLIFRKKINDKAVRVIFFLLIIGFAYEIAQPFTSRNFEPTRLSFVISNLFTLIETLFLFFFFRLVVTSEAAKKFILFLGAFFFLTWIYFFVQFGKVEILDIAYGLESICIIGLSIYYFFEQIRKPDSLYIYSRPRFWLVTAYLIYTAGTFFLFLYQASLSIQEQKQYFILNSVFVIIKSITLSIAMLMKSQLNERRKFELT